MGFSTSRLLQTLEVTVSISYNMEMNIVATFCRSLIIEIHSEMGKYWEMLLPDAIFVFYIVFG